MNQARASHVAAVVGGFLHVIGGSAASAAPFLSSVERYDPVAETWTTLPTNYPSGVGVRAACAVVVSGKIYVLGGEIDGALHTSEVHEFDPATNTWNGGSSSPHGFMLQGRSSFGCVVWQNKIYIFGGFDGSGQLDDCEVYDPANGTSNAFSPVLPTPRQWHGAGIIGSVAHVFGGGFDPSSSTDTTITIDLANPTSGWVRGGNLVLPRHNGAAVSDPAGAVHYLGGVDNTRFCLAESLANTASCAWSRSAGTLPVALSSPTVSLLGGAFYLCGGESLGVIHDELWVNEGPWSQTASSRPSPRSGHTMAFDGTRVILFGGANVPLVGPSIPIVSGTWGWDGTTWVELATAPNSPSMRHAHGMAYDEDRGKVVLFGGCDGRQGLRDTWVWDGAATTWTRLNPPSSPSARNVHRMAYDPASESVLLFGGEIAGGQTNDTWAWDGTTWQQLSPATQPSPRKGYAMATDHGRGVVVLFGGEGPGSNVLGDTWEWDGTNWAEVRPSGAPTARKLGAMTSSCCGVVLVGGVETGLFPIPAAGDTWAWDGRLWTRTLASGRPGPRERPGLAYDPVREVHVLFGGLLYQPSTVVEYGDTWEASCATRGVTSYGKGTPHVGGEPQLHALGCPRSGNLNFALGVTNGLPGQPGVLMLGVLPFDPPLGLACPNDPTRQLLLNLNPIANLALTIDPAGSSRVPAPIPFNPTGCGFSLYLQFIQLSLLTPSTLCNFGPVGVAGSSGLHLTIQ